MQLKHIIICLTMFFVGNSSDEETMSWSETRKLSWSDFKANPDTRSDAVALTASGITFGYSVKTSGKRIVDFSYTVQAHFYPKKSWYVKERGNDYILKHEQLHFDITELYVRKFRQMLQKLVVNQNIKTQMDQIHVAINKALDETQKTYDAQTKHSIDVEVQKHWETFVESELRKLEEFKST